MNRPSTKRSMSALPHTAEENAPATGASASFAGAAGKEAATRAGAETPFIRLSHIAKAFGSTVANEDLNLSIRAGEVLGLVGANGAGKSTLMRILCGVTPPDTGSVEIAGEPVDLARYSPKLAQSRGIRIVYQELSLCSNLTVAENFYLEQPHLAGASPRWQRRFCRIAQACIEAIFPKSGIDPRAVVGNLPIGQRQMVEIARAASDPQLKLLILDEPTSSLDPERSADLRRYIGARAKEGVSFVFITHKLREVLDVASRVSVLRNGRLVWGGAAAGASVPQLVEAMGGESEKVLLTSHRPDRVSANQGDAAIIHLSGAVAQPLGRDVTLHKGEIVGLAGLEGSGQKELLHTLFQAATRGSAGAVSCAGSASFVSGDRQREGVFPLWSVLANVSIGEIAQRFLLSLLSAAEENALARSLAERLKIDASRLNANILELSGGNQQKALVARALASRSDVILLDDPTRGIDIGAKAEFYRLVRNLAESGALVVWHSTEDIELLECDRVLVFHGGAIQRELVDAEISEETIVNASFLKEIAGEEARHHRADRKESSELGAKLFKTAPFASLALVFAAIALLNPNATSAFGLDLLLSSAVPLVLVTFAQMFVVGGSEIDLGVGAFAGLVNVVSATILVSAPLWGVLALFACLLAYGAMGALIHVRKIPAIVVTMGASFIWLGCGYTLQATPGGSSPAWLSAAIGWTVPGLPTSIVLIAAITACAALLDRSRFGVVLRGFGNNPRALQQGGWPPLHFAIMRYLVAGIFAAAAGLLLTAVNTASDINAGNSFTLLSIAAVVIGGCQLLGGVTGPLGVACGAVTLSLIGALLGFLGISTDYNALVQGALLIAILALRTAANWKGQEE